MPTARRQAADGAAADPADVADPVGPVEDAAPPAERPAAAPVAEAEAPEAPDPWQVEPRVQLMFTESRPLVVAPFGEVLPGSTVPVPASLVERYLRGGLFTTPDKA